MVNVFDDILNNQVLCSRYFYLLYPVVKQVLEVAGRNGHCPERQLWLGKTGISGIIVRIVPRVEWGTLSALSPL